MPMYTTRFLTNLVEDSRTHVQWNYSGTPSSASNPISNITVNDRYVSATYPQAGIASIYIDLKRPVSIDTLGVLNMDTGQYASPSYCTFTPFSTSSTAYAAQTAPATGASSITLATTGQIGGLEGALADVVATVNGVTTTVSSNGTFITSAISGSVSPLVYGVITLSKPLLVVPAGATVEVRATGRTTPSTTVFFSPGSGGNGVMKVDACTFRRWIIDFPFNEAGFSIGGVLLGSATAGDLGISFSPNSTITHRRQRLQTPTIGGLFLKDETGRPYTEYALQFQNITSTTVETIKSYARKMPCLMVDAYDTLNHVDLADDSVAVVAVWGSPELYSVTLSLRSLP